MVSPAGKVVDEDLENGDRRPAVVTVLTGTDKYGIDLAPSRSSAAASALGINELRHDEEGNEISTVASGSPARHPTSREHHADPERQIDHPSALLTRPRLHGGENDADELDPSAIGRETCPICIVDFETGDDLRVLPCEGRHRFHQACVDPWLLELSRSCPICRAGKYSLAHCVL